MMILVARNSLLGESTPQKLQSLQIGALFPQKWQLCIQPWVEELSAEHRLDRESRCLALSISAGPCMVLPSWQTLSISFISQIPGHVDELNPWIRGFFRFLADSECFEGGPSTQRQHVVVQETFVEWLIDEIPLPPHCLTTFFLLLDALRNASSLLFSLVPFCQVDRGRRTSGSVWGGGRATQYW